MTENNGLSRRKFDFLEHLTMEDLEYLLCLSSDSEEMEELVDAITDTIVNRETEHPTGRLPDVDDAWDEFQTAYNIPEKKAEIAGEEPLPDLNLDRNSVETPPAHSHTTFRHLWHVALAAVLTVVLTLGFMIGAQASGLNVFGALAEWTDELFHYVVTPTNDDPIKQALRNQDIPEELAPAWIFEHYTIQNIETFNSDDGQTVFADCVCANDKVGIEIGKYSSPSSLEGWDYQKDADNVIPFISRGKEFYILSNLDNTTATWSDGQSLMINIWGNVSVEEMKNIISSIRG